MKIFLSAIIMAAALIASCSGDRETFSSKAWVDSSEANRHKFVDDLVSRKMLLGKSESEVESMLGPPSYRAEKYWTYVISEKSQGFNAIGLLQVNFEANAVVSVSVRSD